MGFLSANFQLPAPFRSVLDLQSARYRHGYRQRSSICIIPDILWGEHNNCEAMRSMLIRGRPCIAVLFIIYLSIHLPIKVQ